MPSSYARMNHDRLRSMVQDAHLNLLIGAGTPGRFFSLLGDVERVLTEIEAAEDVSHDARSLARASVQAHFFDGVIRPNQSLVQLDESATGLLHSYGELGRVLNRLLLNRRTSLRSKKLNIFTTNVDLAFEVAFERLGIDLIDGFYGRIRPVYDLGLFGSLHYRTGVRYEHRSEAPTFDLYKLHGSVGWQVTDDPAAPSGIGFDPHLSVVDEAATQLEAARDKLIRIKDGGQDGSGTPLVTQELLAAAAGVELTRAVTDFTSAYERLVIVNPEKQKFATTVLTEVYYELIRRFANELERENSLLLVHGFSFRDEHLRKIVLRCARANPTLHVLVFCWETASRSEYESLIPPEQVPNGNIEYVTPSDEARIDIDGWVRDFLSPLAKAASAESDKHAREVLPSAAASAELDDAASPPAAPANPFLDERQAAATPERASE